MLQKLITYINSLTDHQITKVSTTWKNGEKKTTDSLWFGKTMNAEGKLVEVLPTIKQLKEVALLTNEEIVELAMGMGRIQIDNHYRASIKQPSLARPNTSKVELMEVKTKLQALLDTGTINQETYDYLVAKAS